MTRGHLPDFHWGDGDQSPFIEWDLLSTVPPTSVPPTTIIPTTQPPITTPPSGTIGTRVVGGLVYKAGLDWLVGRFWAEGDDGQLAMMPLQPPFSTLEVFDEFGGYVGGGICYGRRDHVDDFRVYFVIKSPDLVPGTNYIARVTLEAVDGGTVGPRTFPMPVN